MTVQSLAYESAKKAGYDKGICDLAIVEAKRYSKDTAGAVAIFGQYVQR
ncbi:MAG: hypothetical protein R3C99_19285 [Pirellulaceae bacterium]